MFRWFSFLMLLCVASPALAQFPVPNFQVCEAGSAQAWLDVNQVRARLMNNGSLFYHLTEREGYEIPQGSGRHGLDMATLWMGGRLNGNLAFAGTTYGPYEYWPGPLNVNGAPPPNCRPFDRIYVIHREDLQRYDRDGFASPDLRDWPAASGAPVLDGDGIPGNYNLAGGDRPALLGDQMAWWVMNDQANSHEQSQALRLRMEVQVTAFAFERPGVLGRTTFYRYRFTYRNSIPLEEAYLGLFSSPLFGIPSIDAIDVASGSDSLLHLTYFYHPGTPNHVNYGAAPPATGIHLLQGPTAPPDLRDNDRDGLTDEPGERLGMAASVAIHRNDEGVLGSPDDGADKYNYLQGRWKDGRQVTVGGDGRTFSNQPTPFMYPAEPGEYWSWLSTRPDRPAPTELYWHFNLLSVGPLLFQPDDVQEVAFAIVWSQGAGGLDAVRQLKDDVAFLMPLAETLLTPDASVVPPRLTEEHLLGFAQNTPNPFAEQTTLRYRLPRTMAVRLDVYDALGRRVRTLVQATQDAGLHTVVFEAAGLPPGLYLAHLQLDHLTATRRLLKAW